jgi:hypothetical protein
MAASAIGLQVSHLTGLANPGYAWRLDGTRAEVWYWSEQPLPTRQPGSMPCPEMLLRNPLPDGLHLIKCLSGYEATSLLQDRVQRSRWFAAVPDAAAWTQFARDAGVDPVAHPLPAVEVVGLSSAPKRLWSIHTSLLRPLPPTAWALLAGLALAGAAFFALLSYNIKLAHRIDAVGQEHASLAEQSSAAVKLQREIEALRKPISVVADLQPKVLQLRTMARLAEAGIFDETTKIYLQEWEYRNNRIRLQFSVPPEGFALGEFLEGIEKLNLFTDVRLLPNTPPLTVGFQATLVGDRAPTSPTGARP